MDGWMDGRGVGTGRGKGGGGGEQEEEDGYKEDMEKANVAKRLVQLLFFLPGEPSPSWPCGAGAQGQP